MFFDVNRFPMINEGRCQEFTGGGDRELHSDVSNDGQGQGRYFDA